MSLCTTVFKVCLKGKTGISLGLFVVYLLLCLDTVKGDIVVDC